MTWILITVNDNGHSIFIALTWSRRLLILVCKYLAADDHWDHTIDVLCDVNCQCELIVNEVATKKCTIRKKENYSIYTFVKLYYA